MIAALFVEKNGVYSGLPDVDAWDVSRDARLYAGPHPVVAHPPCFSMTVGLGWQALGNDEWGGEVWQSAYGHRARKRTWLFYVGAPPAPLRWEARPGECQVGWFDRNKKTLGKKEASATPLAFRDALIDLARDSRGQERAA